MRLAEVIETLAQIVDDLDTDVVSGPDAARLTKLFGHGERLCAAGKALTARRAADSGEWSRQGARSPQAWLAGHPPEPADNLKLLLTEPAPRPGEPALRPGELT